MNGAAPHHHWGGQILKHTQCCAVSSGVALFTERGASHLRVRCARCDHTPTGELQPAAPPSIHCSTITHQLTWCQSRLFAAALGELGPRLEIAILEYAILQHSLCRRAKFSACGGRAENSSRCQHAARIRVVRGSTRRSLLWMKAPFFKELFVRRRKRSWQLHVMLLPVPRTASILLL